MSAITVDHLLTVPCELIRRLYAATPGEDGVQPVAEAVQSDVYCDVQQAGSREEQGGAVQITTYRVFLPAGTPLRGWDAVRITSTSEVLELEGDAREARSPLTGVAFVEAIVRRTDYGQARP